MHPGKGMLRATTIAALADCMEDTGRARIWEWTTWCQGVGGDKAVSNPRIMSVGP